MNAPQRVVTPFSLMVVGLLMVLLASLLVFQSQQVSTAPTSVDMNSLLEPKSGELIMDQAPYVGATLSFVFALLERIFNRIFGGGLFSSASPSSTLSGSGATGTSSMATSTEDAGGTEMAGSEPAPDAVQATRSLAGEIRCGVLESLGKTC